MSQSFQSATFKLTAYYLAIITVICLVFSTTIYHFANSELQQGLLRQSQHLVDQYPGFDFAPAFRNSQAYKEGSHRILLNLLYFNVFVLVVAGFAAHALAKRTLSPIQQSHEQQKRFTADVSHELRTPLTALKMSTEVALLDRGAPKQELREALQSNLEDAGKLELLINNLLRLTRLEASELQHEFTVINTTDAVQAAIQDVTTKAKARSIAIKTDLPDSLPIRGDLASLEQLFGILLDNAVKYSPPKSRIEVYGTSQNGLTSITVTDHGMGIAAADLPHVFDRFYRADAARSSNGESSGFGLGLSIAKHIADLHQGIIRVSSISGHGTTVVVELPADET